MHGGETDRFDAADKIELPKDLVSRIKLELLGSIRGSAAWLVDGLLVRDAVDVDFVAAGNYARDEYVPLRELWVEADLTPLDVAACLIHELFESRLMESGWEYEDAHDESNVLEELLRDRAAELTIGSVEEAFEAAAELAGALALGEPAEASVEAFLDALAENAATL